MFRSCLLLATDKVTALLTDEAGNVYQRTDRKGQVTKYTYDVLNRLTQVLYADASTENHTHEYRGDRTVLANAAGTYTFAYDAKHRLLSKTASRGPKILAYSYDAEDNVACKTDYQDPVTAYSYDGANRLIGERNAGHLSVSYAPDAAGRILDRILSNGAKTQYAARSGSDLAFCHS